MAKKLIVLEINNDWIKIAELIKKKKYCSIKKIAVKRASTSTEEDEIKQNLIDLIQESGIKVKNIITYIPRSLLTVRNIELPSTDPEEISNMINLQISKETPYSRDEIITDYKITGSTGEGYSKVMLVIIREEIISNYLSIIRSLDIHIDKIGFSSEGILNYYLNSKKDQVLDNKTVALCDIDSNFTDFNIFSNNSILFTRSISIGSNQLTNDQGMWQNKFVVEISRSIDIFLSEDTERDISEIILSGSKNDFHGLDSAIKSELDLPVSIIEPFKNIKISEKIKAQTEIIKDISFSALIGMVSGPKDTVIDLTPKDLKIGKELEGKAKDLTFMGILLIFILIILLGIFFKKIDDKEQILKTLELQLSKTEQEGERILKMMRINEIIEKRQAIKGTALEIFNKFYSVVPKEFYFNNISFEEDKVLIMRGVSSSMSYIFKFVSTLENLNYFTGVKINYTTKRRVKGKELADFEIVCPILKKN